MLNWDDPLQPASTPGPQRAAKFKAHDARQHPHAGDGLVDNGALMATAGAAPSVNPDPFGAAAPATDGDTDVQAGGLRWE